MAWKGKEMTPSKKKLCYLYFVIEESKDELQKCWINQATVSTVKKRFYCGAQLKNSTKLQEDNTGARGDRIILRTRELNRSQQTVDRHDY